MLVLGFVIGNYREVGSNNYGYCVVIMTVNRDIGDIFQAHLDTLSWKTSKWKEKLNIELDIFSEKTPKNLT